MSRPRRRKVWAEIEKSAVEFTADEVEAAHAASPLAKLDCMTLDSSYWAISKKALKTYLKWSKIDKPDWLSDKRDCDNFAAALFGEVGLEFEVNALVLVWDFSGRHAYNAALVVDKQGKLEIVLIEPQTDGFVLAGDNMSASEAYALENGMAIYG